MGRKRILGAVASGALALSFVGCDLRDYIGRATCDGVWTEHSRIDYLLEQHSCGDGIFISDVAEEIPTYSP